MRLRALLIALVAVAAPSFAHAHPHVWADAASEIVFDSRGRIAAIRNHWRFDEAFSAYALQGLDLDRDGQYSEAELAPLAKENVESLKDFDFFTFLRVGDYQAGFSAPTDYGIELMEGRLLLHFTLPLSSPLLTRSTAVLEIYDPEYYVAFTLPSIEAVRLDNPPPECRLKVRPAGELDPAAAATLAEIGPDIRDLPPEMQALTDGSQNTAEVTCGAPAVGPGSAGDAVAGMVEGQPGDLTALPSQPSPPASAGDPARPVASAAEQADNVAASSSPAPASPGVLARWTAWIGKLQADFNRDLTAALKSFREGGAFWWLGGISFLYGIVHAAGPGHGKVVISSYLVANEARIRRGVVIAFISAFVQAVVAVGVIGVLAVVLNMTSMAIDSTAKAFEAGSFALVAALGVYLLVRKGRAAWAVMQGGGAHAHHNHHHHHHGHDHHQHEPRGARGLSAAAAILSVGIRPCTGALVVLVFALSQGIFWAGVASTFVMALGTALTVAALAAFAVGAKGLARRLTSGSDGRTAEYVMLGLELAAAILITALGAVLFLGTVYS